MKNIQKKGAGLSLGPWQFGLRWGEGRGGKVSEAGSPGVGRLRGGVSEVGTTRKLWRVFCPSLNRVQLEQRPDSWLRPQSCQQSLASAAPSRLRAPTSLETPGSGPERADLDSVSNPVACTVLSLLPWFSAVS